MNLDSLVAGVRTAVGYDALRARGSGIVLDADGTATGVSSEFHYILLTDGRFRMECNSSLGWVFAFTGTEGYRVDYTGMVYPLEHWSLEVKTLTAWVVGHYWLDPDSPLDLRPVEPEARLGPLGVIARMPGGVVEAQVCVDPKTFLPQSMSWSVYGGENLLELADYGTVDGVAYPHHIRITADGDITDMRVTAISEAGESAVEAAGTVMPPPNDTYFNLETASVVPSVLTERGLLVKPNVDGCDDVWFILDTGTSCNVIDERYAKDLRMEQRGKGKAIGVGGTSDIVFLQGRVLTLGPVAIIDPVFVDGRYSYGSQKAKHQVGGILGFDFLARCVAEIEVASGAVTIHMPGEYENDSAEWREIIFATDTPAIRCEMSDGLSGIFYLDTGYSGNVNFHTGFVEQHGLLDGRDLRAVELEGYGGTVDAYQTEIPWFEVGGKRFGNPTVILSTADRGTTADRVTAGTIGGGFLSQFDTLILDYPGKRIGFVE
jgi:hypothetical protein